MSQPPHVPPPPSSQGSYTPPPPPPPSGPAGGPTGGGSSDRTLMLALSYIGILGLVPLLVKKDDRDIKWHAINGLGLFSAYVVVWIVYTILTNFVFSNTGCGLGSFLWAISCAIQIGYIVLIIMAIMKAIKGERMRFPVVSDFADKNA